MKMRLLAAFFLSLVLSCSSTQGQVTSPDPESPGTGISEPDPFTLVILPDTQKYSLQYPHIFAAQTRWIVDNKDEENIVFVLHEGDITHRNSEPEWQNADESISILDGVVPYALAVGNHDMGANGQAGTRDTTLFSKHFPVSRYQDLPTFGGVYEPDRMDNCYHLFSAGGVGWLILVLEFGPRDDVLTWADQVVADHPDRQTIIVTHTYLYSDGTLHGSNPSHKWNPHAYGLAWGLGGANDGVEMWDKLVRRYRNISFILNGHVLNDGEGRLVSVGDHGNKVYQILANYQMLANGGNGWLRIMEFIPSLKKVSVKTYSPHLDQYNTDPGHEFELEDVDFFISPVSTAVTPQSNLSTTWGDIKEKMAHGFLWIETHEH